MTDRPTVLIVGSGPTGSTYARILLEQLPDVRVVMVDAGPVVSQPPGTNAKNIADPHLQNAARDASQAHSGRSGVAGVPVEAVMEGTVTARHGTHLIGRAAPGSAGMPAAAVSTCVGGQGVHWTCATPRPRGQERTGLIDEPTWTGHIEEAEQLLHVNVQPYGDSPQALALLDRVKQQFEPDGLEVSFLPVAADAQPDGSLRWSGTDVILEPVADRLELRPQTLATTLLVDDGVVTGAHLRDLSTGEEEDFRSDAVVVAADAIRSPQLLWASGIRPEALGRHLTEHPLIFGFAAVRPDVVPTSNATQAPIDPIRAVINVKYDQERHPFHGQLMYSPVCPVPLPADSPYKDNPAGYVGMGWGVRKWPRAQDRLIFDDTTPDHHGMPSIEIAYEVTDRELAELENARVFLTRAAQSFGEFLEGMPMIMPAGSSLHYMGTLRMGAEDDGTSVCDTESRVWQFPGLLVAGNGVIPTANACNPTLTSVAIAVRGAHALANRLLKEDKS